MIDVGQWEAEAQGPLSESSLRDWLASQGYWVSRYDYPPGTRFPMHRHDVDKIDAVLSGCFRIEMDGTRFDLGPGMWVRVPRGVLHSATVIGDRVVVSLDAIRIGERTPL